MNRIRILDCTLRDGGYINNWKFGKAVIADILKNLTDAHLNIIECGFIRSVDPDPDSTVFASMDQVAEVIAPKHRNVLYAVMIEQREYRRERVCPCSEKTADLIRLTFRRNEWEGAKAAARELMDKGYRVCIQPVGTAAYDDASLIRLLQDVNELNPYAFYLVDTLGVMYRDEMRQFFYLIDNNLSRHIALGFHSHNNLQMSFANAQEIIRLNQNREMIIDSSCYGMGRGVGNLATELIADYINHTIEQKYSLTPILNIVDKDLMPIFAQKRWGYDLPYFLSATFKCHPNYAAHLVRKETLSIEKIEKLLSLIPNEMRNEYQAGLIEELYRNMQDCSIDDREAYAEMEAFLQGRETVILGPGQSIVSCREEIAKAVAGRAVISVNFIPESYPVDALFISNDKRLGTIRTEKPKKILATSNLKDGIRDALFFDYSSLLGEGDLSDNAGAMLIRILKKCGVPRIILAGFDGFDVDTSANYAVETFKKSLDYDTAKKKNEAISKQLTLALSGVAYEILTPTKYEIGRV